MKRLFSTLTGLVLLVAANGCCCDSCNMGCGNPCRSNCGSPCATPMSSMPPANAVSAYPNTYYGPTVAAAPLEALPTY